MLFSALLQHLHAEPPPSAEAQAALLRHARGQADRLQSLFAIPALIACLKVRALLSFLLHNQQPLANCNKECQRLRTLCSCKLVLCVL